MDTVQCSVNTCVQNQGQSGTTSYKKNLEESRRTRREWISVFQFAAWYCLSHISVRWQKRRESVTCGKVGGQIQNTTSCGTWVNFCAVVQETPGWLAGRSWHIPGLWVTVGISGKPQGPPAAEACCTCCTVSFLRTGLLHVLAFAIMATCEALVLLFYCYLSMLSSNFCTFFPVL